MSKKEYKTMNIEDRVFMIRGQKVIFDNDLADLYGVKTKVLNQSVRRNLRRFPEDFMFQLTKEECLNLRCQIGTSSLRSQIVTSSNKANLRSQNATSSRGGRRYYPFVFTEHGVAMLSSVLNSEKAIQVNIAIMRAFTRLRHILATHKELASKLAYLEQKVGKHTGEIQEIFVAIHKLMKIHDKPIKKIGFMKE